MPEPFISIQKLKGFWRERATIPGLIVLLSALNASLCPFAFGLYGQLKAIERFKDPETAIFLLSSVFGVIPLANAIILCLWLYWRSLPRFQSHENAILFAPHYDTECGNLVQTIFERFVYELRHRVSEDCISPIFLPPNQKVQNAEEANRLLNETGARLVVYGWFDQGEREGGKISGFRSVSFTVKHRDLMKWEEKAVIEDLASALAFRAFTIKSANSFIEKEIVVNNLTEVALFFVALSLTLESKLDIALGLLKELYSNITKSLEIGKSSPHVKNFLRSVKRCYGVALDARYMNFYNSYLVGNVTDRSHDKEFAHGEKMLKELLEIDPKRSMYPLRQAIFDLHFDRIEQAFKNIGQAKKLAPENDPAPRFSIAFLCLYKGQYKRAVSEYQKVLDTDNHSFVVFGSVLDFIQSFHERFPDRPEFLFALGFINQNFLDINQSTRDYCDFLRQAKGNPKFNPLSDYAKKQLALVGDEKWERCD